MRCHQECRTCSGSGVAFCLQCHHLREEGRCVTNCSSDYYYDVTAGGMCQKCDPRCLRCSGPTEADCIACKHFKIVRRDVEPQPDGESPVGGFFLDSSKCLSHHCQSTEALFGDCFSSHLRVTPFIYERGYGKKSVTLG